MDPTKSRLHEYEQTAIELARKAGQMMIDFNEKAHLLVEIKSSRVDLVTEADKAIEKFIFDELKKRYPDHDFIGEESVGTSKVLTSDVPTWIVDPIDGECLFAQKLSHYHSSFDHSQSGTMNFVHHFPFCCVSIGLAINQQMSVGVIYAPFLGKLYTAIKGEGAKCDGTSIRVSKFAKTLDQSLLLNEDKISRFPGKTQLFDLLWKCQAVRYIGSACLCLCLIADGAADVYFQIGLCIWDMAAGSLIATEAGAVIYKLNGEQFDLNKRQVLIASNEQLARELVGELKPLLEGARVHGWQK